AALRMFRYPSIKTKGDFETLLDTHGGFTSQGKTLGDTPLWTFLKTLTHADVGELDVKAFPVHAATGDGDKVFLNMLAYIKAGFQGNPANLATEEGLKKTIAKSPQSRMYQASLLKADIHINKPLAQHVALWDKILDTFDNLTLMELELAAQHYSMWGLSMEDPETKAAYLLKSVHLAQQSLDMTDKPTREQLCLASAAYCKAISVTADETKAGMISRAVNLVDALFKNHTDIPAHDYVNAASIYRAAFLASQTPEEQFFYAEKLRHRWDRYFLPANGFVSSKRVHREAAVDYSCAFIFAEDDLNRTRYAQKSADQWGAYLAPTAPTPDDEDQEDEEIPTPENLRMAAQVFDHAAMMAKSPGELFIRLMSTANTWENFIAQGAPSPEGFKHAAKAVSAKAILVQGPEEKARIFASAGANWDKFLEKSDVITQDDMVSATQAWRSAATLTSDITQKAAIHLKIAGMWERFEEKAADLSAVTKRQMAVDYAYGTVCSKDKEMRQKYTIKSASNWVDSAQILKEPQPSDLALMARAFANAGLYTSNPEDLAKRLSYYTKAAELWEAFWAQKPHAFVSDMQDSARLYAVLVLLTKDPKAQKTYYSKAAFHFGAYMRFAGDKADPTLIPSMSKIFDKVASFSQDEKEVAFCLAQKQILEDLKAKAAPKATQL
ncbi:MAG: hypothetical protein C0514_06795, partial [Candidatus Puniceispirillum sp.]|nr:hypothetical protein [Candidatus Puniceispirillum sp.]